MQGSLYKIRLILCTSLDSTRLTDERRKEIKDKEFGTSQNDRREGNQKVEKRRRGGKRLAPTERVEGEEWGWGALWIQQQGIDIGKEKYKRCYLVLWKYENHQRLSNRNKRTADSLPLKQRVAIDRDHHSRREISNSFQIIYV